MGTQMCLGPPCHIILKLIFLKIKKNLKKFITRKLFVGEPFSFHQEVSNYLKQFPYQFQPQTQTCLGPPRHIVLKLIFLKIKKTLKNSSLGNYWSESILALTRRCRII